MKSLEEIINKYQKYIPQELQKEFRADLTKVMSNEWLRGERSAIEFPRGEGG